MSHEKSISSGVQKLFRIFNWESTVPVAFWVKETFNKDWWQQSSIDYSVV